MKNIISILWCPFGKKIEILASNRLRINMLHLALKFVKFKNVNSYLFNDDFIKKSKINKVDVIILHQKTKKKFFKNLNRIKRKIVIYDIFDYKDKDEDVKKMILSVDIITVCNDYIKNRINEKYPDKYCYVVEDCIDYYPKKILPPTIHDNCLSWFGSSQLFKNIRWQIKYAAKKKYKINIISSFPNSRLRKFSYKNNCNFIEWNFLNFIQKLRLSSVSLLCHSLPKKQNQKEFLTKSNNRLITAISHGIPCIVSGSNEYAKILKKFNLNYAIVDNIEELGSVLKYLKEYKNRQKYLEDIQPYLWKKYNRIVIAEKLLDILKYHL